MSSEEPGFALAPANSRARWLTLAIPLVLAVGIAIVIYFQEHATPWAKPMDLSYKLLDEFAPRSLSDFRGRVLVVNLWATWCEPCRQEMDALNTLHDKYERQGLMVIGISDEDEATVGGYAGVNQIRFTIGLMDSLAAGTVTTVRPFTFILDREGNVRHKLRGARSLEEFEDAVTPLL